MKLWILQHYATPPDTVSGTRHFNIAKELTHYNYDSTIFASGFNHATFKEERLSVGESFRVQNVQAVRFFWVKTCDYYRNDWRRMLNMITYAIQTYHHCKELNEIPEIVWASNPHLFSGLVGYLLAKRHSAHFVFEVRDLWPQVFVDIGAFSRWNPMIIILRTIERFIYRRAEKIILLMPNASNYIKGCGVDPTRIVYIPHAIDFDMFKRGAKAMLPPGLEEIRKFKAQGRFVCGYIGAHGIADALDTVVDCCSLLQNGKHPNDVQFVLIGEGSEKQRVQQRALDLGLSNISFYHSIPKAAVPAVIKLFDIGVVSKKDSPLYKYGTSFIKTFDYMACGIPILWAVNSDDSPVNIAKCGKTILAENPTQMAEAVISFKQMGESPLKAMGRKGLEYVTKNHDNKVLVQKLRDIFESL